MSRSGRRQGLSARAERVLAAVEANAPIDATAPELLAAAGTVRGVYDSLATLRGRFLIRHAPGGQSIRITRAGLLTLRGRRSS